MYIENKKMPSWLDSNTFQFLCIKIWPLNRFKMFEISLDSQNISHVTVYAFAIKYEFCGFLLFLI